MILPESLAPVNKITNDAFQNSRTKDDFESSPLYLNQKTLYKIIAGKKSSSIHYFYEKSK